MHRSRILLQTALLLAVTWGLVVAVRSFAESKEVTADRVEREITTANIADWSERNGTDAAREESLREIAGLVNRLDFASRQEMRDRRTTEAFFRRLSPEEKRLFIDLTVRESMGKFMEALDALPAEQRRKFVEDGLREIESGKTEEEIGRARELGEDLMETIANEGLRAYFEKASADTKLDLAPLMESMNEVMQGLRGQEFGPTPR